MNIKDMVYENMVFSLGVKESLNTMRKGMKDFTKEFPKKIEAKETFPQITLLELASIALKLSKTTEDLEAVAEELANIYVDLNVMIKKKKEKNK